MTCSRTQPSDTGEAQTSGPVKSSTLPLSHFQSSDNATSLITSLFLVIALCVVFNAINMFPFTQYEKQGCLNLIFLSGQIKKIPVFRINQPYLNLLVKPIIFSGFLEKI